MPPKKAETKSEGKEDAAAAGGAEGVKGGGVLLRSRRNPLRGLAILSLEQIERKAANVATVDKHIRPMAESLLGLLQDNEAKFKPSKLWYRVLVPDLLNKAVKVTDIVPMLKGTQDPAYFAKETRDRPADTLFTVLIEDVASPIVEPLHYLEKDIDRTKQVVKIPMIQMCTRCFKPCKDEIVRCSKCNSTAFCGEDCRSKSGHAC